MSESTKSSPEMPDGATPSPPSTPGTDERILLLECRLEQLGSTLAEARAEADRARSKLAEYSGREAEHARRYGLVHQELAEARSEIASLHERLGRSEALRAELEGYFFEAGERGDAAELIRLRREVLAQRQRSLISERTSSRLRARADELLMSREALLSRVATWQRVVRKEGPEAVDLAEFISELRRDILLLEHQNQAADRQEAALRERLVRAGIDPDGPLEDILPVDAIEDAGSEPSGSGASEPPEQVRSELREEVAPQRQAEAMSERQAEGMPVQQEAAGAERPEEAVPEQRAAAGAERQDEAVPEQRAAAGAERQDEAVPELQEEAGSRAGDQEGAHSLPPTVDEPKGVASALAAAHAATPADLFDAAISGEPGRTVSPGPLDSDAEASEPQARPSGSSGGSEGLEAADPAERADAFQRMTRRFDRDPTGLAAHLRAGLSDPHPRVRRRVVLTAATLRNLAIRPLLEPLQDDPDLQVRRVVREVLRHEPPVEPGAERQDESVHRSSGVLSATMS